MSWLYDLKVGDTVFVVAWPTGARTATIERCTAHSVWVLGKRFSRAHGFVVGKGRHSSCHLVRYTAATEPRE